MSPRRYTGWMRAYRAALAAIVVGAPLAVYGCAHMIGLVP